MQQALQWKAQTGMTSSHALGVLWQACAKTPAALAQTVMAANAPMLLQRSMVDGKPAEGVMSPGQVAALIGQLLSCEQVIEGIVAQACAAAARASAPTAIRRSHELAKERIHDTTIFYSLHDNGVAEVVLDRPPVNALNAAGWHGLAADIDALGAQRPECA